MYVVLLVVVVVGILWSAASYFFERSIESPDFSVVEVKHGYEIRQYEPYLVAEVEVEGNYEEASRKGFRLLADYIFGNNLKDVNVSMASSTIGERMPLSEKMAMTAPVTERKTLTGSTRTISFVMPSKYTLETLPKPNNPQVNIISIPSQKMAVLRYSWYATEKAADKKKQELLTCLKRDGVPHAGEVQTARYNAPYSAPWLNRNEVLVEAQ